MEETLNKGIIKRPQHAQFRFTHALLQDRELRLGYALEGGPDPDIEFEEVLHLPSDLPAPDTSDPVVQSLIDGCHRVFGVSYFKAAIPTSIKAAPVSRADADFWNELYSIGLGEFYYRNGISPRGRIDFPCNAEINFVPNLAHPLVDRSALVLLGGGKDSALVADIVGKTGGTAAALSLGDSPWIRRSASAAKMHLHILRRSLDKRLFELNEQGAWNGHIPISACIAFVSMLVAYSSGFAAVMVGNERGAEEHNLEFDGYSINHQWSKTLRFEQAFRQWCSRHMQNGPEYFSMLRPMSEIHIASLFAKLPEHLSNFTSCNINFRQAVERRGQQWCGKCPKCVFVYLVLSPHLSDAQAQAIFADNFLASEANQLMLAALLGVHETKPWECVGTVKECRLSFTALYQQGRLPEAALRLIELHPEVLIKEEFTAEWNAETTLSNNHCIPEKWMDSLNAYIRNH